MDDKIVIDQETYTSVTNEGKDEYLKFLRDNPFYIDVNEAIEKNKEKRQKQHQKELEQQEKYKLKKQKELEEKHQRDEDYRYIPSLVWLEMYLPRFEMVYGEFVYSKKELSNKQKCEELLNYFGEVCGITDIQDIFKMKPHKSSYR